MKKVSPEEIEKFYAFTRRHYVEYYDVQTELVDHLANGIETQWEENPDLVFDEAIEKEFRKFGIFGFTEVVEKVLLSLIISSLFLLSYVCIYYLPKKKDEILNVYPEMNYIE